MLHKNTSDRTIRIPSDCLAPTAWTNAGTRPAEVAIPPGGLVDINRCYGVRIQQDRTHTLPSTIHRLTAGALVPYGDAAKAEAEMLHHELPEVLTVVARTAVRERARGDHGDGTPATQMDTAEAEQAIALEIGRRILAAQGGLRSKQAAAPVILDEAEVARREAEKRERDEVMAALVAGNTDEEAPPFA